MYSPNMSSRLPTARTRSLSPSRARGFFSHSKKHSYSPSSRFSLSSLQRSLQRLLQRPLRTLLLGGIIVSLVLFWCGSWIVGDGWGDRERLTVGAGKDGREGGWRVVARDWGLGPLERFKSGGKVKMSKKGKKVNDEVVLILTPMRNSIEHMWHYFQLLDSLTYPRHLLQIGILDSDSTDRTYERALELADERQYRRGKKGRFGRVSVFRKNFLGGGGAVESGAMTMGVPIAAGSIPGVEEVGDNVGKQRHDYSKQIKRRQALAKSRTWLMQSAIREEVDWVVWIDVDVVDYEKDLVETLIEWAGKESADVVVPNCMWKTYNEMGSYDRNNWQETKESLEYKRTLGPDDVLIEGYKDHPTHRLNMADYYPPSPLTPSSIPLDGVGGCTALIRADVHREGGIFPAWPVDHQLETEGFAQIAKRLGKKLIGLPGYYVYHGLYG